MNLMVTGAAGFIGSHFVRLVRERHPDWKVTIFDALTYSGNRATMQDLLDTGVAFVQGDIADFDAVDRTMREHRITHLVNFAAESHNDRSLNSVGVFLRTNAIGVEVLLDRARAYGLERVLHVSTDEVYGTIDSGQFTEQTPLAPNTPYSAAKAAGDFVCRAHFKAYGTPVVITRGGNTYGPYQYPEKLISFFTVRLILGKRVPLYGDGLQVREWIHARDHAAGILTAFQHGTPGEVYNVGDENERPNRWIVDQLLAHTGRDESFVRFIEDPRKGAHDARYSMTTHRLEALGWRPEVDFETGLRETVRWYQANEAWWSAILEDPRYQSFVHQFYGKALGPDL